MASEQKSKVAVLKTPQDEEITISYQDALGTLRHDRHMKRAILGIPFPVVYFCLFVAMLFQHVPTESLYQQAFSVSSVLDSTGTDAITTDTTMKYENIQTISDVFDWLTSTFVPNVFITTDYNNDTLTQDKWGRIAMFNKVLGAVNLETTTAKIHPCQAQPFLTTLYPQCYDAANVNTSNVLISFDTSAYEATDVIARLKARGDWLDFATQQLVITVVTYNGELQGYTVSKLQLDFHQGGYIELSSTITPTISDPYKKTAAITLDVLVGICFLATILDPAWHFVKAIRQDGRHFLRKIESWGLVDLCSTGFVAAFYGLWFSMVAMMYTKEFRENLARLVISGKTFDANSDERLGLLAVTDALEEVANITIAMRLLAMLSVFALGAQILTQFRFHPRLNILTRTIANALHQFAAFFVVFIVIFMTFSVSGMVLFGDRVEDFSTLPRTFEACINMLFGNFDYSIIRNLQAPVGMLYYWAYMVVVCLVLLNMMLAIVLDSYAEVTEQSAKIKRSASFRRTLENIMYDWSLAVATFRHPATINSKQQIKQVVYRGRIIPAVLERALLAQPIKASTSEWSLTTATLRELFPGIFITDVVATQTIQFLVNGSSNHIASNNDDEEDQVNRSGEKEPIETSRPGAQSESPTPVLPVSPCVDGLTMSRLTEMAERLIALENKLDLLLTKT